MSSSDTYDEIMAARRRVRNARKYTHIDSPLPRSTTPLDIHEDIIVPRLVKPTQIVTEPEVKALDSETDIVAPPTSPAEYQRNDLERQVSRVLRWCLPGRAYTRSRRALATVIVILIVGAGCGLEIWSRVK